MLEEFRESGGHAHVIHACDYKPGERYMGQLVLVGCGNWFILLSFTLSNFPYPFQVCKSSHLTMSALGEHATTFMIRFCFCAYEIVRNCC